MQEVIDTYVNPRYFGQPTYNVVGDPVSVYTPETDYGSGLTQGVADLDAAIKQLLDGEPRRQPRRQRLLDEHLDQTQEMINLAAAGAHPNG